MLGYAKGVAEHGFSGGRIETGGIIEQIFGDAGHFRNPRGSILFDGSLQGFKTFGPLFDELLVVKAFLDDDVHQTVKKGYIGAGAELQPDIGLFGKFNPARVCHDQFAFAAHDG